MIQRINTVYLPYLIYFMYQKSNINTSLYRLLLHIVQLDLYETLHRKCIFLNGKPGALTCNTPSTDPTEHPLPQPFKINLNFE